MIGKKCPKQLAAHARTNRQRCESRGVVRPASPLNGILEGGGAEGEYLLRDDGEVTCIGRRQVVGPGRYDGPAQLDVKLPGAKLPRK